MFWLHWEGWVQLYRYKCRACGAVVESEHRMQAGPPPNCPNGCKWVEPSDKQGVP